MKTINILSCVATVACVACASEPPKSAQTNTTGASSYETSRTTSSRTDTTPATTDSRMQASDFSNSHTVMNAPKATEPRVMPLANAGATGNGKGNDTWGKTGTPSDPSRATPVDTAPQYPTAAGDSPTTPKVDNTKNNARDKGGTTLTPMDQGKSDAERKITATIRKNVVGDKALSMNAKNVKIITQGDRVTLRGVVKTDAEKSAIERYAYDCSGVGTVDNQLEVKQ